MSDLGFVILSTVIFVFSGSPFVFFFAPLDMRFRWLSAGPIGVALCALVFTGSYVLGIPLHWALLSLLFWSFFGMISCAKALYSLQQRPKLLWPLLLWGVGEFVLLAPKLLNPEQFAVFQGNHWDTFGYLVSAAVYSRIPYSVVSQAGHPAFIDNPLLIIAQANLSGRPSAHLLFAGLCQLMPRLVYRLHYSYLVALMGQAALGIAFLAASAVPAGLLLCLLTGFGFAAGFWGQFVLDINAWSQVSSIPVYACAVGWLIQIIRAERLEAGDAAVGRRPWSMLTRAGVVQVLLLSAGLYLYPESFVVHAPALAGMLFLLTFLQRPLRIRGLLFGVACLALAALSGFLFYSGVLGWLVHQSRWVSSQHDSWSDYFFKFLKGRNGDDHLFALDMLDWLAGVTGLYFLTPSARAGLASQISSRILIMALIGLLGLGAWKARRSLEKGFSVFFFLLVLFEIPLLLEKRSWEAGKLLSYLSPYLCIWLFAALSKRQLPRMCRAGAAIVLTLELLFGLYRVDAVRKNPGGIHYYYPYPAIQQGELKAGMQWSMGKLLETARDCRRVQLSIDSNWQDYFTMITLLSNEISYFDTQPARWDFGTGATLGEYQGSREHDCEIRSAKDPRTGATELRISRHTSTPPG